MATLVKGIVGTNPKHFISEGKGTHVLKFVVFVDGQFFKRVPVVVFGPLAEKHRDLAKDQGIMCSGDYKENTWNDETTMELAVGWKGNIKLVGEIKIARNDEPESDEHLIDYDDAPEIEWFTPTDREASDVWEGWCSRVAPWQFDEPEEDLSDVPTPEDAG